MDTYRGGSLRAWWSGSAEAGENSQEGSSVASTNDWLSDLTLSAFSDGLLPKQHNLYKTELCRSWEETGACRYGVKCQFAHGKKELREVSRHPKYKTEICCTFATTGTCPYGRRCRFIHQNGPITLVGAKQFEYLPAKSYAQSFRAGSHQRIESLGELVDFGARCPARKTVAAAARRLPIFVRLSMANIVKPDGQYQHAGNLYRAQWHN